MEITYVNHKQITCSQRQSYYGFLHPLKSPATAAAIAGTTRVYQQRIELVRKPGRQRVEG
jgi:hypothetical protein